MPWPGRDLLGRFDSTSVSTRMVSPWNSGLGKRTSSQPRFATVVPSVVSPTVMPTISPRVKALLTMRWPNSVSVRQYSSSRCSAAGLCVKAEKKTLSASVMVRRMTWRKTWPTSNSSNHRPGIAPLPSIIMVLPRLGLRTNLRQHSEGTRHGFRLLARAGGDPRRRRRRLPPLRRRLLAGLRGRGALPPRIPPGDGRRRLARHHHAGGAWRRRAGRDGSGDHDAHGGAVRRRHGRGLLA